MGRKRAVLIGILVVGAARAFGQESGDFATFQNLSDLQEAVDYVWILAASALVFLMQAGFMTLESGMARAKNSINISIKNMADFVISVAGFWMVGFGIMFGRSQGGLFGTTDFFMDIGHNSWRAVFFVFQAVFAGTAATIDSGAVAERTKFSSYIIVSFFTSALIYPVFGHWAWGSFLNGTTQGWLEARGFLDFAGSTVVHSIGGWVALAGVIVVGPRIGKYDENGKPHKIHPHNLPLVYLGTFILFFGWFGFNAGSTLGATPDIAAIALNTLLAASFGALAAATLSWILSANHLPEAEMIANGVLAGLVGITAGCAFVETTGAVVIGLVSGIVVFTGTYLLEHVFKLDDVVGAIPVHGLCGVWGTLAVGLFITPEHLAATGLTRLQQIGVQALGVGAAFLWAFPLAFLLVTILTKTIGMRVSAEAEEQGLNIAEHGASSSLIGLATAMSTIKSLDDYDQTTKVDIEYGTEVGELASYFNDMIDAIRTQQHRVRDSQQLQQQTLEKVRQAQQDEEELRKRLQEEHNRADDGLRKFGTHMGENVDAIRTQTDEMEQLLSVSTNYSTVMTDSFESMVSTIQLMLQSFDGVIDNTEEARTMVNSSVKFADETMRASDKLSAATAEIASIIASINDIAEQTRLLSVNATIEAARAGSAGSGFKVVASEIKALAERSATSADEIADHLKGIKQHTQRTTDSMLKIAQTTKDIQRVHSSISENVNDEMDAAGKVRELVQQSADAINQLKSSLGEVGAGAQRVSERVAESFQELSTLIEPDAEELESEPI